MIGETMVDERLEPSELLVRFMADHNLVYRSFGQLLNKELARREYPPHSISFMTLNNWATGKHRPDPLIFEWLSLNASDNRIKFLAADILESLRGQEDEE